MQGFKILEYQPESPSRKPRINARYWESLKCIICKWLTMGLTHKETLEMLSRHFEFGPSIDQLKAQLRKWSFYTYGIGRMDNEASASNGEYLADIVDELFDYSRFQFQGRLGKYIQFEVSSENKQWLKEIRNICGIVPTNILKKTFKPLQPLEQSADALFVAGCLQEAFLLFGYLLLVRTLHGGYLRDDFEHVLRFVSSATTQKETAIAQMSLEHLLVEQASKGMDDAYLTQVVQLYLLQWAKTDAKPKRQQNLRKIIKRLQDELYDKSAAGLSVFAKESSYRTKLIIEIRYGAGHQYPSISDDGPTKDTQLDHWYQNHMSEEQASHIHRWACSTIAAALPQIEEKMIDASCFQHFGCGSEGEFFTTVLFDSLWRGFRAHGAESKHELQKINSATCADSSHFLPLETIGAVSHCLTFSLQSSTYLHFTGCGGGRKTSLDINEMLRSWLSGETSSVSNPETWRRRLKRGFSATILRNEEWKWSSIEQTTINDKCSEQCTLKLAKMMQ